MPTAPAPDERMPMLVPVGRGIFDRLNDLLPRLEAAPLQREPAEDLPPRFNQVQIRRTFGLEEKLPAQVRQREQQHVGCPMHVKNIEDCVDCRELRGEPGIDLLQEVNPVGDRAPIIRLGEGRAVDRSEGAEDVTLAAAPVINLLRRPLDGTLALRVGDGANQLLTAITLRRFRAHLIQAHAHAAVRRRRVNRDNCPLFCANSGSIGLSPALARVASAVAWPARSPNQPSWVRQRKPSASRSSSMRLRRIAIPFSSLRYVSSRSSVQLAKGCPRSVGLVKEAASTSPICSAVYVGGCPERGASVRPSSPAALKRLSHRRTVSRSQRSSSAMAATRRPWCASQMIRARSTARTQAVRDWTRCSIIVT